MEELEAVYWYNQWMDACKDGELKAILAHNRNEEKEHAAIVLEWIRRQDPTFDKELKDHFFTDDPIAHQYPTDQPENKSGDLCRAGYLYVCLFFQDLMSVKLGLTDPSASACCSAMDKVVNFLLPLSANSCSMARTS